jgi:hypothetical protein
MLPETPSMQSFITMTNLISMGYVLEAWQTPAVHAVYVAFGN